MRTPFQTLWRSTLLSLCVLATAMPQAQAHGGGGWRGGHHHHHGGGAFWVGPALIGGAILGATLARPSYAYPLTPAPVYSVTPTFAPTVVPYGTPMQPQPVGYFCPTSGQFYPYVATCNVPWQLL